MACAVVSSTCFQTTMTRSARTPPSSFATRRARLAIVGLRSVLRQPFLRRLAGPWHHSYRPAEGKGLTRAVDHVDRRSRTPDLQSAQPRLQSFVAHVLRSASK